MKKLILVILVYVCGLNWFALQGYAQSRNKVADQLTQTFLHPPEAAKPWIYWYWMQASVSKEGITADLESMKEEGIEGAYLMPIKGPAYPPYMTPPVEQLS